MIEWTSLSNKNSLRNFWNKIERYASKHLYFYVSLLFSERKVHSISKEQIFFLPIKKNIKTTTFKICIRWIVHQYLSQKNIETFSEKLLPKKLQTDINSGYYKWLEWAEEIEELRERERDRRGRNKGKIGSKNFNKGERGYIPLRRSKALLAGRLPPASRTDFPI